MAERAETLAHMTGAQNPVYSSVDAWSFSVALRRAQAYYPARLAVERPDDGSVQAQAQSALRKRFYTYAAKEVARGYVREGDSFEALFPRLPANTAQDAGDRAVRAGGVPGQRDGRLPDLARVGRLP